jgi:hypothetical protein
VAVVPAPPVVPPSCSPARVTVVLRAEAIAPASDPAEFARRLREAADGVLTSLADRVDSVEIVPVIRAFRAEVRDAGAAARMVDALAGHPNVQTVAPDECTLKALGR